MKMHQALTGALLYAAATLLPLQAQTAAPLAQQMGPAQFHAAGLDQLSPAQLSVLEAWLAGHGHASQPAVAPSQAHSARLAAAGGLIESQNGLVSGDVAGTTAVKSKPSAIDSHIAGRFSGWGPGSVIELSNGQRWRVIDDSRLELGRPLDAPAVHIARSLFGSWTLRLKGYNTRARLEPAN